MAKYVPYYKSVVGKRYDGMMGRCYRPKDGSYQNYGGRGIRVCAEWIRSLEKFRDWFDAEVAELGLTQQEFVDRSPEFHLDRIDTNGHYTPEICRLIGRQDSARNQRRRKTRTVVSSEGIEIEI